MKKVHVTNLDHPELADLKLDPDHAERLIGTETGWVLKIGKDASDSGDSKGKAGKSKAKPGKKEGTGS